jgi:hypothetical protein
MWYVWTSVLCVLLNVCDANRPGQAPAPQRAASDVAFVQEQPQPSQETGEKPQQTPRKRGGKKQGQSQAERSQGPVGSEAQEEQEIEPPTGPMRVELMSISESRIRFEGQALPNADEPAIHLQVKVTGERLGAMVGMGHLVIEKMVDDTGAVLASPEDLQRRDLVATSPIRMSKRVLAAGFLPRTGRAKLPSRAARKLTEVSGWVNVIYADETEDVLIDDPLQYLDSYIEHPRLQELGVKIRVVRPDEEAKEKSDSRGIALDFHPGKMIRNVEFFDAWMKPMYPRARRVERPDGKDYMYYNLVVGRFDADTQMMLTLYPQVEEERIRFKFENVELP